MRDFSDRSQSSSIANAALNRKRLGGYLVEAGLLTPAQIDVALNDQKLTGMRFGEILAARGWVKQQTIEYLMKKVVLPEQQQLLKPDQSHKGTLSQDRTIHQGDSLDSLMASSRSSSSNNAMSSEANKQVGRRDVPISKPLPSVNSADGDVSWVG